MSRIDQDGTDLELNLHRILYPHFDAEEGKVCLNLNLEKHCLEGKLDEGEEDEGELNHYFDHKILNVLCGTCFRAQVFIPYHI